MGYIIIILQVSSSSCPSCSHERGALTTPPEPPIVENRKSKEIKEFIIAARPSSTAGWRGFKSECDVALGDTLASRPGRDKFGPRSNNTTPKSNINEEHILSLYVPHDRPALDGWPAPSIGSSTPCSPVLKTNRRVSRFGFRQQVTQPLGLLPLHLLLLGLSWTNKEPFQNKISSLQYNTIWTAVAISGAFFE